MISNATDHLALARAAQQGLDWPPALLEPMKSSNVELKHMLQGLDIRLQEFGRMSRQLESALSQGRKAVKDNVPNRESIEQQVGIVEQLQKRWDQDREVARRVLEDAMARSKPEVQHAVAGSLADREAALSSVRIE